MSSGNASQRGMVSPISTEELLARLAAIEAEKSVLEKRVTKLEREKSYFEERARFQEQRFLALFNKLFRPKSEKLNEAQIEIAFEAMRDLGMPLDQLQKIEQEVAPKSKAKRKAGRRPLPPNLQRERIEYPLPEEARSCACCGQELTKIREEKTEQLEFIPSCFKVIEHVRGVYACKGCEESILTVPMPPQPIAKGLPGPGLLAHVAVSKYGDHLPLYRQSQIFERHGVDLSRSTLCDWIAEVGELLTPLVDWMHKDLLQSAYIQTDDTPVTVIDEQAGPRKGRLWVYLGDRGHPHVVYHFTTSRENKGPLGFLRGFRGYLQADAYGGYDAVYAGGEVTEVACWAHARRYFFEAFKTSGDSRAAPALAFIKQLFEIERGCEELADEDRQQARIARATPVLDAFELWYSSLEKVLPKSPLAQAIGYATRQRHALRRYLEHGELRIDNNASERALRAVAVGRKNWLFAGSEAGGDRAAKIYTLIASAKRVGLEPYAYLKTVLQKLPTQPPEQVHELAPAMVAASTRGA